MTAIKPTVIARATIRSLILLAAALLGGSREAVCFGDAENPVETIKDESELHYRSCHGRLMLSSIQGKDLEQDSFVVELRYEGGGELYNPVFNPLLRMPGELLVFDQNGKFLGDLFQLRFGSMRTPHSGDCMSVPRGSFVGTRLTVTRSQLDRLAPAGRIRGKEVRLQLVLNGAFTYELASEFDSPERQAALREAWEQGFTKRDIARSNVLVLRLTEGQ
jgi:hypothetical protein